MEKNILLLEENINNSVQNSITAITADSTTPRLHSGLAESTRN
ncbi:hypothetical protein HME9304_01225 [Flagellimonas maritima]|uniref:Uncharacterized protein n=1 Tax=Flagellimonas maritima TaxID=1383885 RepID=A0A2Z4LQU5_9FLAO|nr:hypothetical protein HME9304_01225 [Allomuricauda aurantiaca]